MSCSSPPGWPCAVAVSFDKLTGSEFGRRSQRQLDEKVKAARSDFVVDNSGSRTRLKATLAEVYAFIIAAANERRSGRAARRGR